MERTDNGTTLPIHAVTLLVVQGRICIVGAQIEDRVVTHHHEESSRMRYVALRRGDQRKAEGADVPVRQRSFVFFHFAAAASPQCGFQKGAMTHR